MNKHMTEHETVFIYKTPHMMSSSPSSTLISSPTNYKAILNENHVIMAFCVSLLVFITIHSLRQKRLQGMPCWPFLGMLPSLVLGLLEPCLYQWITEALQAYDKTLLFKGPWFIGYDFVIIWDPRNLEYLLKTKFTNFPKGPFFRDTSRDFLGDGIFNSDGDMWRRQRKTSSIELFHTSKFRDLTTSSLNELVHSRLLPYLEHSVQNSVSIDLQDLLLRLTFDNICILAFGIDPYSLAANVLPNIPFAQAFQDATEASALRFCMPSCIWKLVRYFNVWTEKWIKESIMIVDDFAYQVIQQRKKELSLFHAECEPGAKKSDLLTVFMGLQDEEEKQNGKPYSDKFLRDICVNFILAGRDTSSVAMSWFFWLIYRNPRVEVKIMEEIMGIIGNRKDMASNKNELVFSPEEVKKMEYLHAALSEALRLYPSVPLDFKQAIEDDVFPDGTIIKKGEKVIYSMYSMGRMEAIWGRDCNEFKPERWLNDGIFTGESAYKFTAFNGGPRLCLGKDFAYYQMKFVVASIMYRYTVKVDENHVVVPKVALTLYMKHGLKVNLYKHDVINKYIDQQHVYPMFSKTIVCDFYVVYK